MIGLAGVTAAAVMAQGASLDIKSLSWMSGSWSTKHENGIAEEGWSDPASNSMSGYSRFVANGTAQTTDYYSIEKTSGGVILFVVTGNGQKGLQIKRYRLIASGQKTATFECEEHPFPRTIKYTRLQDGTLQCVWMGAQKRPANGRELTREEAGAQRKQVFAFRPKA